MLDLEWERPVETLRGCSALPMPVIYGAVFEWFENFLTFLGKENPDSKYQLFYCRLQNGSVTYNNWREEWSAAAINPRFQQTPHSKKSSVG